MRAKSEKKKQIDGSKKEEERAKKDPEVDETAFAG